MPKRTAARISGALLTRLAGQDDGLDFGIYRTLAALRGELERLLASELPAALGRTLAPQNRAQVYDWLEQLAERWEAELLDCAPARPAADQAPASAYHVHATSPLESYAFRMPSGRRVVFQLQPTTERADVFRLRPRRRRQIRLKRAAERGPRE
jgi:hypothetical protein